MHVAAQTDNKPVFDRLIQAGANVHAKDSRGRNLLHYVAAYPATSPDRGTQIAEYLVKNMGINAQDSNQQTPLDLATIAKKERSLRHNAVWLRLLKPEPKKTSLKANCKYHFIGVSL
ncbi:MAG: hypothetical protein C5B47_06655 [Verrucomicrobia bacterium]|nr:MAG: hypothetical protein C5B47_06655 [Verrucomicrobiota bacterium]